MGYDRFKSKDSRIIKDMHPNRRAYLSGTNDTKLDCDECGTSQHSEEIAMIGTTNYAKTPAYLIDHKFANDPYIDLKSNSAYVYASLARHRDGTLPFFFNIYYYWQEDGSFYNSWDDFNDFDLINLYHAQHILVACNQKALDIQGEKVKPYTEDNYYRFLCNQVKKIPYNPIKPQNTLTRAYCTEWRKQKDYGYNFPIIQNVNFIHED